MRPMNQKALAVALAGLLCMGLSGCTTETNNTSASEVYSAQEESQTTSEAAGKETAAQEETVITLKGDTVQVEGAGAKAEGSGVTISQAGVYRLTGTLTDGTVLVDAEKDQEVRLILDGADITCTSTAPICVEKGLVTLELAEGSENTVTDGPDYVFAADEDEPDATIFSKDDLTLAGTGSLTVNGNYDMAIHGKDNVTVSGGVYTINALEDGLKGKDSVLISGGSLNIQAGDDGIQSNNDKDQGLGNVRIEGGTVNVTAGGDGIKAETKLELLGDSQITVTAQEDGLHAQGTVELSETVTLTVDAQEDGVQAGTALNVSGGTLNITTGGGAANAPAHTEDFGFPGWFDTNQTDEEEASAKGLKSDGDLLVSGGTITLDCMDDALHCAGTMTVAGDAVIQAATGDDGLHSDDTLSITGGTISISQSYEGLEAVFINISGGDISLMASDDGLNAAGGSTADTDFDFMGPGGEGKAETLEEATYYVHITGGTLQVDAGGDGLDSNGALYIDGGEVYVSGPSDSMNGGLDYTTTGQVNGGIVVVAGASGMAQNFDSSSSQASVMYTFDTTIAAGSQVTLTDSSGKELVSTTMAKSFNNVVISLPELTVGETYTLTCGTETAELTLTDTITTLGNGGFGGGPGGGGPGGGGPGGGGPGGMVPPNG